MADMVRLLDVEVLVDDAAFGAEGGTVAYYVRGHMDIDEFISYLASEYGVEAKPAFVKHRYMTKVPDRTGEHSWTAAFRNSPQRGAMAITHFDLDGQSIASYYDRHPELVSSAGEAK